MKLYHCLRSSASIPPLPATEPASPATTELTPASSCGGGGIGSEGRSAGDPKRRDDPDGQDMPRSIARIGPYVSVKFEGETTGIYFRTICYFEGRLEPDPQIAQCTLFGVLRRSDTAKCFDGSSLL